MFEPMFAESQPKAEPERRSQSSQKRVLTFSKISSQKECDKRAPEARIPESSKKAVSKPFLYSAERCRIKKNKHENAKIYLTAL